MANVEKVCEFLDKTRTYYLATVDGDQPRVRPFGTVLVYDGKLYIQTGKVKPVSKQLAANPKAEICAFDGQTGTWLRVSGELINEENADAVVNTLVEKLANTDAAKKAQENVENSKNWLKDNQDTIDAINVLLETLKN